MPPRKKRAPAKRPEQAPEQAPEPVEEPVPEPVDEGDDELVEVPFGDDPAETATLLLAAAEEAGDQSVVRTGTGVFIVPKSIAKKAEK